MSQNSQRFNRRFLLRTAALAPLAGLSGCAWMDDLFESSKATLPGRRESILGDTRGLRVDPADHRTVSLPPAVQNADWPQAGGGPSHVMGNVALSSPLKSAWSRSIGEGGGYRRKITAAPVIAGGQIYTMDSDGMVRSFNVATGERRWETDTQADENRSTNVGGGLAVDGAVVYASTGRAEALALNVATGKITWRSPLDAPARSAPTIAAGKLFVATLDERLVCLSITDGKRLWNYQATSSATIVLGEPAPAYSDGLVVAGFGSGDLLALRADSGTIAWSDSLAAARGRTSLADLSAIRALPVISNNTVYAIGIGGLMVAIDLRSGRRLWERQAAGLQTPWVAGDWIFVLTDQQILVCLSRIDGRVRWLSPLPRYENEARSQDPIYWTGPLLGGQYLYLAGSTQKLLAVNAITGEVLGQQDLPDKVSVSMVAAGGKLFVVTDDSSLTALG
jgi:outer membrane protein assembly factor BamB